MGGSRTDIGRDMEKGILLDILGFMFGLFCQVLLLVYCIRCYHWYIVSGVIIDVLC